MDQQFILPRASLIINLAPTESRQLEHNRLRHFIHLVRSHRVSATWAVGGKNMAQLLREHAGELASDQVALAMQAGPRGKSSSSRSYSRELAQELSTLSSQLGQSPVAVVGDSQELRSRMVLLSQLGIQAIIADEKVAAQQAKPRALPCGMWHLRPQMQLPQQGFWQRFSRRKPSVREVVASAVEGTTLVSIDAAAIESQSARGMQTLEHFLRDISWGANRGQLEICSLTTICDDLRQQNQVKPQRSIMRVAA